MNVIHSIFEKISHYGKSLPGPRSMFFEGSASELTGILISPSIGDIPIVR
jgi:hypothetical protein